MRNAVQFTHIINPFPAAPGSPSHITQEITFRAIQKAIIEARHHDIHVECLGATFRDEVASVTPPAMPVGTLERSILDFVIAEPRRRLPLISDILNVGTTHGSGQWVVFTNMDIIPQPYFYCVLERVLQYRPHRYQFVIINRRTVHQQLPASAPDEHYLRSVCSDIGVPHEGWDCFVFPREWIPRLALGDSCVGLPFFDGLLALELDWLAGFRGSVLTRQMLTCHIGDDKAWKALADYSAFNLRYLERASERLKMGRPSPADSVSALVTARLELGPWPAGSLTTRVLRRLRLDDESVFLRWTAEERRKLGMPLCGDPAPGLGEWLLRSLRGLVS